MAATKNAIMDVTLNTTMNPTITATMNATEIFKFDCFRVLDNCHVISE